jgi:hypothetical protein
MQIKVNDTRSLTVSRPLGENVRGVKFEEITVVEAKLVLVKSEGEACGSFWMNHDGVTYSIHSTDEGDIQYKALIKPILISETEKIEAGVDYMFAHGQIQEPDKTYVEITGSTKKILALPEHFSPKLLQDIVDGVLKSGDKVLIECQCEDGCVWGNWGHIVSSDESDHVILHAFVAEKRVITVADKLKVLSNDKLIQLSKELRLTSVPENALIREIIKGTDMDTSVPLIAFMGVGQLLQFEIADRLEAFD